MIFMMSTKEHESSLRIIIYHFAVLKICFLNLNRDLNDRVSLCINKFCEVVKCVLYS